MSVIKKLTYCDNLSRVTGVGTLGKGVFRNLLLIPIAVAGDNVLVMPSPRFFGLVRMFIKDAIIVPPVFVVRKFSNKVLTTCVFCNIRSNRNILKSLDELLTDGGLDVLPMGGWRILSSFIFPVIPPELRSMRDRDRRELLRMSMEGAPTGLIILKIFEALGEANPYQVYRILAVLRNLAPPESKRGKAPIRGYPSYDTVRCYIFVAHKLGLLVETRREPPSRKGLHEKVYYKLAPYSRRKVKWWRMITRLKKVQDIKKTIRRLRLRR